MTELLYQTDSYLQTFDAAVTALDEANHGVILDRTAFYPGGGGHRKILTNLDAQKITAYLRFVQR